MSYRILCDEHVEPQTVRYLERAGHEARHVGTTLTLGVDDEKIVQYARENDFVILTNDRGFLDESRHLDVRVLPYTDNRVRTLRDGE